MAASSVKVNPLTRTTLTATVDTHGDPFVTLLWSFPDMTAQQVADSVLSLDRTQTTLVIKPTMTVGSYSFVLTASEPNSHSSATMTVVINQPPRNGYVSISPTTGVALNTSFSMLTSGWVDDPGVRGRVHDGCVVLTVLCALHMAVHPRQRVLCDPTRPVVSSSLLLFAFYTSHPLTASPCHDRGVMHRPPTVHRTPITALCCCAMPLTCRAGHAVHVLVLVHPVRQRLRVPVGVRAAGV